VSESNKRQATYQDVLDAPEHLVAEIIAGELRLSPRPGGPHIVAASRLGYVDWICEVLSKSTAVNDRAEKLPIYGRVGVRYAWLVDAIQRTLEVLRLQDGVWLEVAVYRGDVRVRAQPFDAIEIDLVVLWEAIAPRPPRGTRASEEAAVYVVGSGEQ
jgi:hypothetical protein